MWSRVTWIMLSMKNVPYLAIQFHLNIIMSLICNCKIIWKFSLVSYHVIYYYSRSL